MSSENITLQVVSYSAAGDIEAQAAVEDPAAKDAIAHFSKKFKWLSGDLDLPLEEPIPEIEEAALRICSESSAAYVIYYLDEEPVMASLIVAGVDEEAEFEIMSTFKFLLLQGDTDEEPDDETIDAVMAAAQFDFEAIQERPATFQIQLNDDPKLAAVCATFKEVDLAVAAAFIARASA